MKGNFTTFAVKNCNSSVYGNGDLKRTFDLFERVSCIEEIEMERGASRPVSASEDRFQFKRRVIDRGNLIFRQVPSQLSNS